MRAVRDSMIISPPLVLTHEEADILVETARKTLDDTYQTLKKDGWLT
jgi:putrescine aminotransferase